MITMEDAEEFADKIEEATTRVADDYASGDLTHEEPFSDQLCGRLKETLHGFETPNFRWQAEVAAEPTRTAYLSTVTSPIRRKNFGGMIRRYDDHGTFVYGQIANSAACAGVSSSNARNSSCW